MQKTRVNPAPSVRIKVLVRDGFRCIYCGATSEDAKIVCDHVIPVCKGGTNDPGNLVAACEECNSGKAGRLMLEIVEGDVGVYVNQPEDVAAKVPELAADDTLRESPASLWIPVLSRIWPSVDPSPRWVNVHDGAERRVDFHPTFACTGRGNSDIAPYPCSVRILVLPWRSIGDYTVAERQQTLGAVISGYTTPTIIILGTPNLFFAVLVNERHKGCPVGQMVDQFMEPFREWRYEGWYPDEDFDFRDLREPFIGNPEELSARTYDAATDRLIGVYCSNTGEAL